MIRNQISNFMNVMFIRRHIGSRYHGCRASPNEAALCPDLGEVVITAFSSIGPGYQATDPNRGIKQ
jgi:hypothetical protein